VNGSVWTIHMAMGVVIQWIREWKELQVMPVL
jgi:hypothetical protein